jgi:hypothetical protein
VRRAPPHAAASDDSDAAPASLPPLAHVVEPGPGVADIPADARPDPPYTMVLTEGRLEKQPVLARYGDLAVHRNHVPAKSAAGMLTVTHEGSGLALAHFSPRQPGRALDPATLLEALAFAWDIHHQPETRAALDAVMRIVPRKPTQRALEAALRKHRGLFDAWGKARDWREGGRVDRYQQRHALPRSPFALAAAALAPAPAPRPPAHRTRSPFAAAAAALGGVR